MLNLRMYGSDIWFDNQWVLRHLPPKTASEGDRFRQNIFRWIYEYRKLEYSRALIDLQQVKPQSLEPYPGPFLEPGLIKRIRRTAFLRSLGRPDKKAYRRAAKAAAGEASAYAEENCAKYFEFQYVWPEAMARLDSDKILTTALVRSCLTCVDQAEGNMAEEMAAEHAQATQAAQEAAGATRRAATPAVPAGSIDPGMTSEIRLNIAE